MRAKQVGPEAERARAALPQLYAIRRRLHNAEDDMRRALTAGREQLREFMKCDAMKVLTKSQKDEVRKFAVELDDVIAGKRKIESLSGFDIPNDETPASCALRDFMLQRGDLLLVRNRGMWSRFLIDASCSEKRFSHAEIVTAPFEVVSVGVDEKTGGGVVCANGVESRTRYAEEIAVYRYAGPDADKVRERIARAAEKRIGTPFDPTFDLKTKNRLYCTEMVRDSVNEAAGYEVIGTSRKEGFEYVAIDDCYRRGFEKVFDARDWKGKVATDAGKAQSPTLKPKQARATEPTQPTPIKSSSTTNRITRIRFIPGR